MAMLVDFLRDHNPADLVEYFKTRMVLLPDDIPWNESTKARVDALLIALDELGDPITQRVLNDAERVNLMVGEAGQRALYSTSEHSAELDARSSSQARALWLLLNQPQEFARAEEARFADERRMGRSWVCFHGPKAATVLRTVAAIEALRQSITDHFGSKRAIVEICDRTRVDEDDASRRLVQVAIYREGRAEMRRQIVADQLEHVPDRPVIEATVTYEPDTGLIEAVAPSKEHRLKLAEMVCDHLMEQSLSGERVKLRQYRLDMLRRRYAFPTDPEDQIEGVQLKSVRLMPFNTPGERITLECMRGAKRDLWAMSAEEFGDSDPLLRGHRITQVRFTVQFRLKGPNGKRTLPVTINVPDGCDLKDGTRREQLIGRKYLSRWGIVAEAGA